MSCQVQSNLPWQTTQGTAELQWKMHFGVSERVVSQHKWSSNTGLTAAAVQHIEIVQNNWLH